MTTPDTTPDRSDPEPSTEINRWKGDDRVGTAVEISRESFPDGNAGAVVLARSDDFADALAGTPLAVARNASLLLTATAELDPAVAAEIQRVLPPGRTVLLLGGPAALTIDAENAVIALGYTTQRFQGVDRYATAVAIAEGLGNPTTLLLATGQNFPDAAAAGTAAASRDGAVLLTAGDQLPAATFDYLAAHPLTTRFAVGGPAAAADPTATPLFGDGRYETAVVVAEEFFDDARAVGIVSGEEFADSMAGGTEMGRIRSPMLLTGPAELSEATDRWLRERADTVVDVYLFGGSAAVSTTVEDQIRVALGG